MTDGLHQLWLDDIDLVNADPTLPYQIEAIRGFDPGNPVSAQTAVRSLLRDGSLVTPDPDDNRSTVIPVRVTGADSLSLAQGEAALMAKVGRRINVTWVPPDGWAPPSVFKILNSSLELVFDDLDELLCRRVYKLSLTALPYTESETETVTPAQPAVSYTVIDNGSATTNWTTSTSVLGATVTGPTVVGGKVTSTVSATSGGYWIAYLTRTASVNLSAYRYLVIDVTSTVPLFDKQAWINGNPGIGGGLHSGTPLSLAMVVDLGGGVSRYFFTLPAGTGTVTEFTFGGYAKWAVADTLAIDQVQGTDALPTSGTTRQQTFSMVPGGSVRTQGTVAVSSAASNLGNTLVFSYPSGFGWTPPLRPWLTSSTTVTGDGTLVSGARHAIATACAYTIPSAILPPGSYTIMARLRSGTTATTRINFAAYTQVSGSNVDGGAQGGYADIPFTASVWQVVTLGRLILPVAKVGPAGSVVIVTQRDAGSAATIDQDEVWLFHESGDLTLVNCGVTPGTPAVPAKRLWIDAPTLDNPQGSVFVGTAANRSDSFNPGSYAIARAPYGHNLQPAGMNFFVMTENATDAVVTSSHYKRWHTHAAE